MTRNRKMLLGGAALAVVGLGAAGAVARQGHHGWGHHGGGMHGGFFGPGFGHMGKVCRDGRAAEMVDHMAVRIEHRAKPTEAQRGAFDELKTAMKSAAEKLQAGCPAQAKAEPGKDSSPPPRPSPVERLANAEQMTAATLEAIKTVRPAAEKFYAQLSDEQKASLTPERKGRGWWRHRDRGPDGGRERGPGRGPDRDDDGPDMP